MTFSRLLCMTSLDIFAARIFMSVGRDVKWCPVSRITTPLATRFTGRLARAARKIFTKFHKWSRLLIVAAFVWHQYCRYGVKHYIINQSETFPARNILFGNVQTVMICLMYMYFNNSFRNVILQQNICLIHLHVLHIFAILLFLFLMLIFPMWFLLLYVSLFVASHR